MFPVPDGDTGTNMLATVKAALEEADKAGPDADAERIAQAASFGALMGARGNSGVITSQIFKGIEAGMVGKRRFNGLDLAHALDLGAKTAYKAVARPVEGTILTVIREAAAAAVAAAERDNNVESVLAAVVEAAEKSVAKTPSLLPILREAHVVDSGGQGLFRLFEGALEAARGRSGVTAAAPAATAGGPRREAASAPTDETEFGYETVYLVRARPGRPLDLVAIQAHLETLGDSVLVAGDAHMAKVHVHNERPDAVIAYGLSLGALSRITIENLDGQAHDVREAKAAAFVGEAGGTGSLRSRRLSRRSPGPASARRATRSSRPRRSRWVSSPWPRRTAWRRSSRTRPPTSGSTARSGSSVAARAPTRPRASCSRRSRATQADELLILPNNPNVVLAARQVASMTDRPIHIVPTRNVAEGVAALFELDPLQSAADNAATMTAAGRALQTLQVTEAVRDATVSGHKVKKGQTIVLDPDDGLLAADNDPDRAVLAAFARLEPGFAVVTIYYGEDATLDAAEVLAQRISEAAPGLEGVDLAHGGQPHYRYLISAE